MRSVRLLSCLVSLFFVLAMFFPGEPAAEDSKGKPIMEEAGIGAVYLENALPENIDTPCLADQVRELVLAVDNHQVSYLKMLIFQDDSAVTEMIAGPHLVIRRDTVPANDVIISLDKGAPHFLSKTGQDVFSAGLMPDTLDFSKCMKKAQ